MVVDSRRRLYWELGKTVITHTPARYNERVAPLEILWRFNEDRGDLAL
jgi:hypothetical protein